jgi:CRISPR/Cas system-associated exonuclease Cas4 (RecB family)
MKHLDMNRFKDWLEAKNLERLDKGLTAIDPFYPYDFLNDSSKGAKKDEQTPLDFKDILFLKGTEDDVKALVNDDWNKSFRVQLRFFTNTMTGLPATVSEAAMNEFFECCIRYRGRFELCLPLDEIESKDKVEIKKGVFAGHEATVVSVRHSKGELNLELAVELVSGVMSVKMYDVKAHEIVVLNKDATSAIRNDFIEYTQNNLLSIYKHRVMAVNDDETRRRDLRMLSRLNRYRAYKVESRAAKTHFTALMLICAHLRKNVEEEAELRKEVLQLLADINRQSESKAATDIRTYLWIALYISTNLPVYRDACKQYLRTHQPKSKKLREFISLMRKGKKV